jgi:hypothetical protein
MAPVHSSSYGGAAGNVGLGSISNKSKSTVLYHLERVLRHAESSLPKLDKTLLTGIFADGSLTAPVDCSLVGSAVQIERA